MLHETNNSFADWPEPVEILNETGSSDIVLICEHAANHIPKEYRGLGLDPADLKRHIAWDIGAAEVTRVLSKHLDATAFLSSYSRLLIDLNRPIGAPDSIPIRSEGTEIFGNVEIDAAEKSRRAELMFTPFHNCIATHLDRRKSKPTRIVTIHSFTPVFLGVARSWHAGVLHGQAKGFAEQILASLQRDISIVAEANVPYVIGRNSDYAVPVHGDDRGFPAVLLEIRQDLIARPEDVAAWANRIFAALGGP